jgi:hypothetical protein
MLTTMPMKSRDQRIRDEFAKVGPMSVPAFARHCVEVGIWAEHELSQFAITTVQGFIRVALKAPDRSGLPFAGQTVARADDDTETEEGDADPEDQPVRRAKVWAQRSFWNYEDYDLNIREAVAQRDILHFHATDMADECHARFGRAPLIVNPVRQDKRNRGVAD